MLCVHAYDMKLLLAYFTHPSSIRPVPVPMYWSHPIGHSRIYSPVLIVGMYSIAAKLVSTLGGTPYVHVVGEV